MAGENTIQIGATVDLSELKQLTTQSDAVADAYRRLAEAQLEANNSATVARNTLRALGTGELPAVKAVLQDYANELKQSAQANAALKAAQEDVAFAIRGTTREIEALREAQRTEAAAAAEAAEANDKGALSMLQYRQAAQLAGRELGVTLPRALTSLAIQSEGVRNALNAAFSGIIALAFANILVQMTEKLADFVAETFIFTQAERDADAALKSTNTTLDQYAQKIKAATRELQLHDAKSEEERGALKLRFQIEDQGGTSSQLKAQLQAKIKELSDFTKQTEQVIIPVDVEAGATKEMTQFVAETEEGKKKVGDLQNAIELLSKRIELAALTEKNLTNSNSDDLQKMLDKQEQLRAAAQKKAEDEQRRLLKEGERQYEDFYKHAQELDNAFNAEQIKGVDARVKNMIKGLKEQKEAFDANLQDQVIAAQGAEKVQEQQIEQSYLKHQITQQQEIAALAKAKQDELAVEIAYLRQREELWSGDAKKIEEFEKQIAKIQQQSALIGAKAVTDGIKAQQQEYQKLFSGVFSGFTGMISGLVQGNQTILQSFQQMYQGILQSVFNFYAQKLEKEIAAAIESQISQRANAATQIQAAAATGGAWSYADLAAEGPVGLAAAPAVAAATSSAIEAFDIGLFEKGGIVPMTGLAILHQGETVIPASKSGTGAGLPGGGGVHIHFNMSNVDGQGAADFIKSQSRNIANVVYKELKKKGFNGQ